MEQKFTSKQMKKSDKFKKVKQQSKILTSQSQVSNISSKSSKFSTQMTFTNESNYKERASMLFDKLNSFKSNLEDEKYEKFSEVLKELKQVEDKLEATEQQKQDHFNKVLATIAEVDKEINLQKLEFNRFKKILQNLIETTNRECQIVFDKMTKESETNQNAISKFIDIKVDSFVLKNKRVWLEQDLLNFESFKEELNYLKKEVQQFYRIQQKQIDKFKKEVSDNLDKQKQFLMGELKRTDNDQIMRGIEGLYSEITRRVAQMSEKRQNVQKNVLSMIQNIIDSYIRDSNKFK